jgi:hypothetical protein
VRTFCIPTDAPEADGTIAWDATTMVVVTVAAGGHTGLGYTYAAAGPELVNAIWTIVVQRLKHLAALISADFSVLHALAML